MNTHREELKRLHPDKILLFRERGSCWAYGDDAREVKRVGGDCVGYSPQSPGCEAVANVGRRDLEAVLVALLRAGLRVALCDQVPASEASGQKVERVVTPGPVTGDDLAD